MILKSIDKAREKRFQTADEFVAALEQVETEPVSSIPAASEAVASEPIANEASTPSTPVSQVATVATPEPSQPVPAPTVPEPEPSQAVQGPTPQPVVVTPVPAPVEPQPAVVSEKTALPPDSVLVKSAAQHVFLQPRKFQLKHLFALVVLCLAGALVAWVGYAKYQVIRRAGIENEVRDTLKNASSATVHLSGVTASITDLREVILEGNVPSREDSDKATLFAGSVHGVTDVHNHIRVTVPVVPSGTPAASADSLINDGTAHMDKGEYDDAIKCFTDAGAADPQNKKAQEWLDRAQRAKTMEEKLLKNRQ